MAGGFNVLSTMDMRIILHTLCALALRSPCNFLKRPVFNYVWLTPFLVPLQKLVAKGIKKENPTATLDSVFPSAFQIIPDSHLSFVSKGKPQEHRQAQENSY